MTDSHRYLLTRDLSDMHTGEHKRMTFVMLNPSTADETKDDPTIRRCISFAKRENCSILVVVNLFAKRCTNMERLYSERECASTPNDGDTSAWGLAFAGNGPVVAGWGSGGGLPWLKGMIIKRTRCLRAHQRFRPLLCLGSTKAGFPKHPLYIAKDTPLVPYEFQE